MSQTATVPLETVERTFPADGNTLLDIQEAMCPVTIKEALGNEIKIIATAAQEEIGLIACAPIKNNVLLTHKKRRGQEEPTSAHITIYAPEDILLFARLLAGATLDSSEVSFPSATLILLADTEAKVTAKNLIVDALVRSHFNGTIQGGFLKAKANSSGSIDVNGSFSNVTAEILGRQGTIKTIGPVEHDYTAQKTYGSTTKTQIIHTGRIGGNIKDQTRGKTFRHIVQP